MFFKALLALLLLNCIRLEAQVTTFHKAYTNVGGALDLQKTSDGNYVLTGNSDNFDLFLMKLDSVGGILWKKNYSGSAWESGWSVKETPDSGFIVAGSTFSFGNGRSDALLIRTDKNGNLIWSQAYGSQDDEGATSIQVTKDGGFIVTGTYIPSWGSDHDIYLFRTDSVGQLLWSKTYSGADYEDGYSVLALHDNGILLLGSTSSANGDGLLMRTDSIGNIIWCKTYGGSGEQYLYSLKHAKTGGFIMAGYTSSFGMDDGYVVRIDSTGNLLWSKQFGSSDKDRGTWIEEDSDGFILSGYSASSLPNTTAGYLVRMNKAGDYMWSKKYSRSASDHFSGIHAAINGGYIINGITIVDSFKQFYLVRIDSLGEGGCFQQPFDTIPSGINTLVTTASLVTTSKGAQLAVSPNVTTDSTFISTFCLNGVGIKDFPIAATPVAVFPNPCPGIATIRSKSKIRSLEIRNAQGVIIYKKSINFPSVTINLSGNTAGLYFYSATLDSHKVEHGKLVLQ